MTFRQRVRQLYVKWLRPLLGSTLAQQRVKLFWLGWGYYPLLTLPHWSVLERLRLLKKFLAIEWQ